MRVAVEFEKEDVIFGEEDWIAATGVADGPSMKTVLVTRVQVELASMSATLVGAGGPTVTKAVEREHRLLLSCGLDSLVATTRS